MSTPLSRLEDFAGSREFFIGIDSDGCVFDSMEIKHKECFCPAFINHYGLQAAAKYAREIWEFVNLYSTTRGANRFKAVLRALDLCRTRADVAARNVNVPVLSSLTEWVGRESKLGNPQLAEEINRTANDELQRVMAWSLDVNKAVEKIVRDVPPFPAIRGLLTDLQNKADVIVVSQTPAEALVREWRDQEIDGYVQLIAGQELGTKSEHLEATAGQPGTNYGKDKVLMIGDAPGDLKAAQSVGALFLPILPGREEESWNRFAAEGADRFFAGTFAGEYQQALLDEFSSVLPEDPSWEQVS